MRYFDIGEMWLIRGSRMAFHAIMFENVNPFDPDEECE